jgi:hypothetical protein
VYEIYLVLSFIGHLERHGYEQPPYSMFFPDVRTLVKVVVISAAKITKELVLVSGNSIVKRIKMEILPKPIVSELKTSFVVFPNVLLGRVQTVYPFGRHQILVS